MEEEEEEEEKRVNGKGRNKLLIWPNCANLLRYNTAVLATTVHSHIYTRRQKIFFPKTDCEFSMQSLLCTPSTCLAPFE